MSSVLPVMIEDLIGNLLNNKTHVERRQFYYTSANNIRDALEEAIKKYERERDLQNAGRGHK